MLARLGLGLATTSTASIAVRPAVLGAASIALRSTPASIFLHPTPAKNSRQFSTYNNHLLKAKKWIPTPASSLKPGESEILIGQRKNRPISPHLSIYQPQLTWYLSSVHRLTLISLGAIFYAITIAFGVSMFVPNLGDSLRTEKLTKWCHDKFSGMSEVAVKGCLGGLFGLQLTLAVRHLIWDTAKELTLKGVYRTGYLALAVSAGIAGYLMTM